MNSSVWSTKKKGSDKVREEASCQVGSCLLDGCSSKMTCQGLTPHMSNSFPCSPITHGTRQHTPSSLHSHKRIRPCNRAVRWTGKNTPHWLTKGEKDALHLIRVLANYATLITVEMCSRSFSQPDKLPGAEYAPFYLFEATALLMICFERI